jgi:putative ABC transport system permease protein
VSIDGDTTSVVAYDPATVERVMDLDVSAGALADIGADGIAIQSDTAAEHGWSLGDSITVGFPSGPVELTVAALYDQRFASGEYVVGLERFAHGFPTDLDQQILVNVAAGDTEATREAIEAAVADFPTVRVMDREEFNDEQAGQIDQFLALIYGLLGLAVLIALIGIVNTLGLSIHERTRELGLLRAIGMSRRQLRAAIRWEAIIIASFGTLLGLGLGVVFGTSAVSALGNTGIERIVIPTSQLAVIALLGALAGIAAATLPARRAARLDVLSAISAA